MVNWKSGPLANLSAISTGGFPGQPGNPVGFAAAPGFPGSLNPSPPTITSGSLGNPNIYSFYDFIGSGVGQSSLGLSGISWVKFVGCRFQSTNAGNSGGPNVNITGGSNNITFSYCSFVPLLSQAPSIPNARWPSSVAGLDLQWDSASIAAYSIDYNKCHQYGLSIAGSTNGPLTCDHCDFWGFGNVAVNLDSTTAQMTFQDCWMHDACQVVDSLGINPNQHTDGIGYLNGGTGTTHITVDHCTIASPGNTNGIAFQGFTSPYQFISVTNSYLCGFGNLLNICFGAPSGTAGSTNITCTGNIISSDIPWSTSPTYGDQSTTMRTTNNNLWRNNRFRVYQAGGINWWSGLALPAADGQYLYPDSSWNNTDYTL